MPITPPVRVNGNAPRPDGVEANSQFALGATVNLTLQSAVGIASLSWECTSKPSTSTGVIATPNPIAPFATTFGPLDAYGTYLFKAIANGDPKSVKEFAVCVLTPTRALRIPGVGETTQWDYDKQYHRSVEELYLAADTGGGGGGGGGLATNTPVLTVALDPTATHERAIAFNATHFSTTDGGANSTFAVALTGNFAALNLSTTGTASFGATTVSGLTVSGLTASRYVVTNGSKALASQLGVPIADITVTGGANGDVFYFNGTNIVRLAAGTNGHVLTLAGGVPTWAAPSSASDTITHAAVNTTLTAARKQFATLATGVTLTLPASPNDGDLVTIKALGNGTIAANAGQTIEGGATASILNAEGGLFRYIAAGTTWACVAKYQATTFTAGGDLRGTSTVQRVSKATGDTDTPATSRFTIGARYTVVENTVASPEIKHEGPASDTAPTNLRIESQAPFATATGANRKPGDLVLAVPSPTNGGTTHGKFSIDVAGSERAYVDNASAVFKVPVKVSSAPTKGDTTNTYDDGGTTTDATPTNLTPTITIPNNSGGTVFAHFIATRSDGTGCFTQTVKAAFIKSGGTLTLGTRTKTTADTVGTGTTGIAADLVASSNNVRPQGTGLAATDIRWGVRYEVEYRTTSA